MKTLLYWLSEKEKDKLDLIIIAIEKYFSGDEEKTYIWFLTKNPLLGNVRPLDMIISGRLEKLELFVKTTIE